MLDPGDVRGRSVRRLLSSLSTIALLWAVGPTAVRADTAAGDRAWGLRAEGLEGQRARPGRIEEAIAHYRRALRADPAALEPRWKLLRALQYAVDFTTLSAEATDAHVRDAVMLARESIERLESPGGGEAGRARLLFWSSIAWGLRAQRAGLLTIVREGVATRMHDCARRSLDLDPSVDRGGALRLLSRLHATLPRVPFVSGWVDRDQVLPLAERGHELDPGHPGNRLVLALALLERAPSRRPEGLELLRSVADAEPRPDFRVEDLRIRSQARERLAALEGAGS